jgi:hypothetical protein
MALYAYHPPCLISLLPISAGQQLESLCRPRAIRILLVTFIITWVPTATKFRVSSGNKPAQYFIKAQAKKITSPGF